MVSFKHLSCLAQGLIALQLVQASNLSPRQNQDLNDFIQKQSPVSLEGILNNIGPDGSAIKGKGVSAGVVIASPSTKDPNYFYTWTRDSALTLKLLVDSYIHGNAGLGTVIQDYIISQSKISLIDNKSGTFSTGAGLGEPKYYSNETAFNEEWGRPQRDGPALRATTLIQYSKALQAASRDNNATVKDVIWPIVSNDLNYVAQYWNETGFDLWEEVNGSSYFTTAVQYRALVEGATFAESIDEKCEGCSSQAPGALCFMQDYWNGTAIISNINLVNENKRSGLDCNSILTSIHLYDPKSKCTDSTFQPCSARALSNHKAVVDSFRGNVYTINSNIKPGKAAAVGRYAEDIYYEGNPWYLCTLAAAEQLYSALNQWNSTGSLTVDNVSETFFNDLIPDTKTGDYASDSDAYKKLTSAVRDYADGFVSIVEKYTPENGALDEQFSRENGTAVSAKDLTWSYASFLTMEMARNGTTAASSSWGESEANSVPNVCEKSGGVKGSYVKPTATSFPDVKGNPAGQEGGSATGSAAGGARSSAAAAGRIRPFLSW